MKLMCPKSSVTSALCALFLFTLISTATTSAQSRRGANSRAAQTRKAEVHAKDAKKARDKSKLSAKDKKKDTKSERLNARERAKLEAKEKAEHKKDPERSGKDRREKSVEARQAAAERRRIEAERREAIMVERRRREQAAREALERRLAFERGLRTETVSNILNDSTDGEDLNIRAAAVNALGHHAGSVVVMEAQTGKILTIVNQNWAVRSSIRPCSTIKLVTAAAALNEGVINKETGSIRNTPTRRDLDDAIAFSDNGYFQRAGAQIGSSKLIDYGKHLGLGQQTGINLDGEVPGKLPYGNNNARIYSHGDDTEVTTLQLAVLAAAITNGGHRVLPRVPRNNLDRTDFHTFYRAEVDLPQSNVRRMIPGMMGAAAYGTAHRGVDQSLGVAGKTGSCTDKGSWVGLFASVAPIEKPKYAVAVITRGQGERGKYAAAVAGQIYRALSTHIARTNSNLAQQEFQVKPKYDAKTAARLADQAEDEEASDSGDESTAGRPVIVMPSPGRIENPDRTVRKKLVTKTGDSKALFPPVIITYDKDANEYTTDPHTRAR